MMITITWSLAALVGRGLAPRRPPPTHRPPPAGDKPPPYVALPRYVDSAGRKAPRHGATKSLLALAVLGLCACDAPRAWEVERLFAVEERGFFQFFYWPADFALGPDGTPYALYITRDLNPTYPNPDPHFQELITHLDRRTSNGWETVEEWDGDVWGETYGSSLELAWGRIHLASPYRWRELAGGPWTEEPACIGGNLIVDPATGALARSRGDQTVGLRAPDGTWTQEPWPPPDANGSNTALAYAPNGDLHGCYFSVTELKHARLVGDTWETELVDPDALWSGWCAVGVLGDGTVRIAYLWAARTGEPHVLRVATSRGGTWEMETFAERHIGNVPYDRPWFVVDNEDTTHLTFVTPPSCTAPCDGFELTYANDRSGSWHFDLVGRLPSDVSPLLAVDSAGRAHIVYNLSTLPDDRAGIYYAHQKEAP